MTAGGSREQSNSLHRLGRCRLVDPRPADEPGSHASPSVLAPGGFLRDPSIHIPRPFDRSMDVVPIAAFLPASMGSSTSAAAAPVRYVPDVPYDSSSIRRPSLLEAISEDGEAGALDQRADDVPPLSG